MRYGRSVVLLPVMLAFALCMTPAAASAAEAPDAALDVVESTFTAPVPVGVTEQNGGSGGAAYDWRTKALKWVWKQVKRTPIYSALDDAWDYVYDQAVNCAPGMCPWTMCRGDHNGCFEDG